MHQTDFIKKARANLATQIDALQAKLADPAMLGATLLGEPYILIERCNPSRVLAVLPSGAHAVMLAPALLVGVPHFDVVKAGEVAHDVRAAGGPDLVPALARSWQVQRLDEMERSLLDLDDLLAKQSAEEGRA